MFKSLMKLDIKFISKHAQWFDLKNMYMRSHYYV